MANLFTFDGIVGALQKMDLSDEQKAQVIQVLVGKTWQGVEIPAIDDFPKRWVQALKFVQYMLNELGLAPGPMVSLDALVDLFDKLLIRR